MKEKNQNPLIFAVVGILLLVFGFYTSTLQYASAISVVSVTFPAGTVTADVTYEKGFGSTDTDTTAYIIGTNGGVVYVWKKSQSDTILGNVTLTGSTAVRAIKYADNILAVYAVTNDKIWKISTSLGISGQFATGTANIIERLIWDESMSDLYFCTNDTYGTINLVTLALTTLYTDPSTNGMRGCSLDETNRMMYIVGDDIGATFDCEIIKVRLSDHTQQNCTNSDPTDTTLDDVCYDSTSNEVWAVSGANSRVINYNSALTLIVGVATGATPRHCSISSDTGANRLYVSIESNDNVSIIDTEADTLITSVVVCNIQASRTMDTKRLTNTTNTFVTCSDSTNSVIVDNTVSESQQEQEFCDLPENANILRCRLGDDELTGVGEEVGSGIAELGCEVIFADCSEDTDPRTNGIGLLIFIASIFVVIGMFYFTIGRDAFHMPIFIWIIIIVALSAFFTLANIIDPVFLVLSIVAVIALAVPKVIGIIQNRGGGFGGGSTE